MLPACRVVVLTITMAVWTERMVQRHVIVRKLSSLEALGGVTNICSDKMATLTQGKMIVKQAWFASLGTYSLEGGTGSKELVEEKMAAETKKSDELLADNKELEGYLNVCSLANLAHVYKKKHEGSERVKVFVSRFSWDRGRLSKGEDAKWTQKVEFPFDSDVKRMTVVYTDNAEKNSPPSTLSDKHRKQVMKNMESLTRMGLRVFALAKRDAIPDIEDREEVEKDLCFLGSVGIYDSPRPESARAVEL
ncbi:hypothetical protein N7505_007343 [Penicillium chrysogenum]|uniref:Uncharacterized protein n=1 Tax=Penicillium chrysogenum TaxID=5076 RepID=A0ABQ8WDS1_PENCH|nr:hypothetical protein N7505_007343 [Penicillium chrysogenum]